VINKYHGLLLALIVGFPGITSSIALDLKVWLIRALENEQDDWAKVNGLFGSLNDWKD
jgi:hypothetical protein